MLLRFSLFPLLEVQLPDGEDANEHGLHGAVVQRGGGEPQGAVGDAAALRVKVEQVGALFDRLWALWEIELVESDWTAERVLCVLHHLQDILLILLLFTPLSWNLQIWLCLIYGYGRVEAQEGGLRVVRVGFGAAHDVGKGQLMVLFHRGEAKVFAAEEEQSVEEDYGGVRPELFTVPQKLLLHTGMDVTTGCDWGFETSQHVGEFSGELVVEAIHEYVFHTTIVKQVLLDAEAEVEQAVGGVRLSVWSLHFSDEAAEAIAQLSCGAA